MQNTWIGTRGWARDGGIRTWFCRQEPLSDLWTGLSNHQPIQPLRHSRHPWHFDNPERLIPGVFDFVFCTNLWPPPGAHWPCVSLIFHHPPNRPDFRPTDWANFQTLLADPIPFDSKLHKEMTIDTYVYNLSGVVLKALVASNPNHRQGDDQ